MVERLDPIQLLRLPLVRLRDAESGTATRRAASLLMSVLTHRYPKSLECYCWASVEHIRDITGQTRRDWYCVSRLGKRTLATLHRYLWRNFFRLTTFSLAKLRAGLEEPGTGSR